MSDGLLDLTGRVIVVAGAGGGGLGTAIASSCARAGATVIGVSRRQDNLDTHLGPLRDSGLAIVTVAADVETDDGVAAVMDAVRATDGTLSGLVTVVGGGPPASWRPATAVTRADWDSLFSTNLGSMFFIGQAVAARMQAEGTAGSIVAISSITALAAQPFNIAYGAAKAAILSVVRTMALELAASGIRVNAIAPGAMASPSSLLPPDPELEARAIPMGRKGDVAEIANAALFLLSDMASYMTGQTLTLDGGIGLKGPHLAEDNTPVLVTNEAFLRAMKGEA